MKLNKGFILHDDGNEKLLVSTGMTKFSGLVRCNATAGFIISCLEHDVTETEIIRRMQEKFDGKTEDMQQDVKKILSQLRKIGALDEDHV